MRQILKGHHLRFGLPTGGRASTLAWWCDPQDQSALNSQVLTVSSLCAGGCGSGSMRGGWIPGGRADIKQLNSYP